VRVAFRTCSTAWFRPMIAIVTSAAARCYWITS
jgi:hypothetical protein